MAQLFKITRLYEYRGSVEELIEGWPILNPWGIEIYVHRTPEGFWRVSEATTGHALARNLTDAKTRRGSIRKAMNFLNKSGGKKGIAAAFRRLNDPTALYVEGSGPTAKVTRKPITLRAKEIV